MAKNVFIQLSLEPHNLVLAYQNGFFPMPDPDNQEILWFYPDPRAIIPFDKFHCSKSLLRFFTKNKSKLFFALNQRFDQVIRACSRQPQYVPEAYRVTDREIWITAEMIDAYQKLHELGYAHSVEVYWQEDKSLQLIGGLYGVSLPGCFFAESMFRFRTNASKLAIWFLVEHLKAHAFNLLEVQFLTPHLESLGATAVPADNYTQLLERALNGPSFTQTLTRTSELFADNLILNKP